MDKQILAAVKLVREHFYFILFYCFKYYFHVFHKKNMSNTNFFFYQAHNLKNENEFILLAPTSEVVTSRMSESSGIHMKDLSIGLQTNK